MRRHLGLLGLLAAGLVFGLVALNAKQPTYEVPLAPQAIPFTLAGEPAPAGFELRTFAVEGICCQSCAGKLERALAPLDGVGRVAVDPVRKEVQAFVRADLASASLVAALTFDKYVASSR